MKKAALAAVFFFMAAFLSVPAFAVAGNPICWDILTAYYDVWKHVDGTWQNQSGTNIPAVPFDETKGYNTSARYGVEYSQGKFAFTTFSALDLLKDYTFTGFEVITPSDPRFNQELYNRTWGQVDPKNPDGGPLKRTDFNREIFKYSKPLINPSAIVTNLDLDNGQVTIKWRFDLPEKGTGLNRKTNRMPGDTKDPSQLSNLAEGYRWYLPAIGIWYGVPKSQPDFYVSDLLPGTAEYTPGETYQGQVTFGLNGVNESMEARIDVTVDAEEVILEWEGQTFPGSPAWITLEPGQPKTFKIKWTAPNKPQVTLRAHIASKDNGIKDSDPSNNTRQVRVNSVERNAVTGPGTLAFQAVDQSRVITRPKNTARWTDYVTATLKPPAPLPPWGRIDWWEITGASLTYPKKNPGFTFGTPYPPVGTKTISMKPDGHVATVEFQEDWGMDGARIYSLLEKKLMAENPEEYTLTARYTIKYQYSWTEIETDDDGTIISWTETRTGTTSGTASGKLLVNGTGVDSRAQ